MKLILSLLMLLWGGVAFSSLTTAIKILPHNNSNESLQIEIFHFNFFDSEVSSASKFESKLNQDSSLRLNELNGSFRFENENVVWRKEVYVIPPGNFSVVLKNSKREIEFSGTLDNITNNSCDIGFKYIYSCPVDTACGPGKYIFSFDFSSFTLKFGKFFQAGGVKYTEDKLIF